MDEERLLDLVNIQAGCHYALENKLRKEREEIEGVARPTRLDRAIDDLHKKVEATRTRDTSPSLRGFPPKHIQKSTVLADAGFEIFYGTDDRVFGNLEPKSMVRRAGRTAFNYGFIGGTGVGKSTMINAMRGMSSKHPLAAGKSKAKKGSCDRFEFDDDLLKYSVTLWELHYPKKINAYFEFIDRHNISNFTAIFVLIDGIPSDEDLSFSKIAYRRNASVVFLSSKSDQKLSSRSRSDEIPVCDLLKQRFVDKGMARFDRALASSAPELCGRVHAFFVSAPVFRALRIDRALIHLGDARGMQFILHERAVFDFLKQKRIIADLLDSPEELKEGLYANVNMDTAGVAIEDSS
uniref:IRG-type G domain-containing protein n=1 Tax=Heterorhabditis bacteriophora TaxID=37862 RepID=A0A1I7XCY3_HETBA